MSRKIRDCQILRKIGEGGSGSLFLAYSEQMNKKVAIKELHPFQETPHSRQRLQREIEVLEKLPVHPNIVKYYESFLSDDKLFYLLEYIDGSPLVQLLQSRATPYEILRIMDQLLSAIEAIHAIGYLHGDITAANILIDQDGVPYITDFGLARPLHQQEHLPVFITPRYASPELLTPETAAEANGPWVDIYSLGIVIYEAAVGRKKFEEQFLNSGLNLDLSNPSHWLAFHANETGFPAVQVINPEFPKQLSRIIMKMIEKNSFNRYRKVPEIRRDLAAIEMTIRNTNQPGLLPPRTPVINSYTQEASFSNLDQVNALPGFQSYPGMKNMLQKIKFFFTGFSLKSLTTFSIMICLFFLCLFAVLWFRKDPGFTLIVKGSPMGSQTLVDGIDRGIPTPDGIVVASGLKAGKRTVNVICSGFKESTALVIGIDGETQTLDVQMPPLVKAAELPNLINYTGEMILINAGEFIMGNDFNQANEKPAHKETLPNYYIDKYEVTNQQYRVFCDTTNRKYPPDPWWQKKYFDLFPQSPVVGVTWEDATAYATWCGKRLPTEPEWEKAASWSASEQKKRVWPWGDEPDPTKAVLLLSSTPTGKERPNSAGSHPTGASPYGVEDMAGNAAEWVDSWYQPYVGNSIPDDSYGQVNRVARGGSFISPLEDARTTRRFYRSPGFAVTEKQERSWLIGFRCVVSGNDAKLKTFLQSLKQVK